MRDAHLNLRDIFQPVPYIKTENTDHPYHMLSFFCRKFSCAEHWQWQLAPERVVRLLLEA